MLIGSYCNSGATYSIARRDRDLRHCGFGYPGKIHERGLRTETSDSGASPGSGFLAPDQRDFHSCVIRYLRLAEVRPAFVADPIVYTDSAVAEERRLTGTSPEGH